MKRLLLIASSLTALCATPSLAADFNTPIALPAGSMLNVTIHRSREVFYRDESLGMEIDVTSRYRLTLEPNAEGYRVKVRFLGMGDSDQAPKSDRREAVAAEQQLSSLFEGLEFQAGPNLRPIRTLDWPKRVTDYVAVMAQRIGSTPDNDAMKAVSEFYMSLTPESAASSLMREWALPSNVQNLTVPEGRTLSSESFQQGPRDVSVQSLQTIALKGGANGAPRIELNKAYAPASARALTTAIMDDIIDNPTEFRPEPDLADINAFLAEDTTQCVYDMDAATGLAKRSDCALKSAYLTDENIALRSTERFVITQELVSP